MKDHLWCDSLGYGWHPSAESDRCAKCGSTPDDHPQSKPAILLTDDEESVERLAAALHFDWCPDKEIRPDHQPGSVDVGQAKRLIEALRRA